MRKRSIASIASMLMITGVAGYLINKKINKQEELTLLKAGIPDQLKKENEEELARNAEMVSEGSQYGVEYYNQIQEKKRKK